MPHLIFSQNGKTLLQIPFNKGDLKIGRSGQCDVVLTEPTISRLQLSVHQLEGSYFVKNLGKAKLKLNGKEVEGASLTEKDFLELENWQIALVSKENDLEISDETYVSDAGMRETQVLNLSREKDTLHYESLELQVIVPGESLKNYSLQQPVLTLGQSASCDISLPDHFVSEVHAKLIQKENGIFIYDLKSTNGTFVNGVKVGEAEVFEEASIQIGHSTLKLVSISHEKKIQPVAGAHFGPLIGRSSKMRELYALIQQVAPTHFPVCIFGETGSGKELVAKCLHDLSSRKSKPWLALNCGAISKELIQSELFGHEKGAFTGAHQQHKGVFEQAEGGTLFLDEIGELPLDVQAILLRVLETGKVRRVGGSQEISVDVRIVCATHRDLTSMVQNNEFREDLFFRLHVLPLNVPPLRERKEDIPVLTEHFVKCFLPQDRNLSLSEACERFLLTYSWPGNVRELKNAVQRSLIFSKGESLEPYDFGFLNREANMTSKLSSKNSSTSLGEVEKQYVLKTLKAHDNNRVATAKALGISKSSLYEKLKGYGVL